MSKIAIDIMGTNLGINPIIGALKVFMKKYQDVTFILVGNESEIQTAVTKVKLDATSINK